MTEQAINDLKVYYNGQAQKGHVYGRIKRTRYGTTKYVSVIRKSKKNDDFDDGFVWQCFERDTPEEATEAAKEGLRKQIGLQEPETILIANDEEAPDIQMILKESRANGTTKRNYRSWSLGIESWTKSRNWT